MRKITMILFSLFIGFNIGAQEVSDKQWMHMQKRTADWCSVCGMRGWDFQESLFNEFGDKDVLIWSTHIASSGLTNPTSLALVNNYGGSGQPVFFRDGANIGLNNNNAAEKIEEIRQLVDFNESFPAFFGCASLASYDGTSINAGSKAKLFVDSEQSVIRMGVYLMKKETVAFQSQQGNNAVHKNLVVDHLTDDTFGPVIVNGDGVAGNEYEINSSIEIGANIDPTEHNVVTVLWSYIPETDNFQFLNAHVAEISNSVSTKDAIETNTSIAVSASNKFDVVIAIESDEAYPNSTVSIYDTNGKLVADKKLNILKAKTSTSFDLGNNPAGLYILNITAGTETVSKQFYLK